MKKLLIETAGWYGALAILTAYILVSFEIISPTYIWYQILNGTGALGIVIVSFYKRAYQPGVLNLVWLLVALFALLQLFY
jgi:hypothetical protein